jgi:hypothetical protein
LAPIVRVVEVQQQGDEPARGSVRGAVRALLKRRRRMKNERRRKKTSSNEHTASVSP